MLTALLVTGRQLYSNGCASGMLNRMELVESDNLSVERSLIFDSGLSTVCFRMCMVEKIKVTV